MTILNTALSNVSVSILMLGLLYMLGLIMDRLSDFLFQKLEDKVRNKADINTENINILWDRYTKDKFFEYVRSKIRILRASTINLPLITISLMVYSIKIKQVMLMFYILIIGSIFTCVSFNAFVKSMKTYYTKSVELEKNKLK